LGRVFGVGERPPARRFGEIGKRVKALRKLLAAKRKVIEPTLVYFARVQETTGALTVHGLAAASAHKVVIAVVEEMLAEPWAQAGFPQAFENAADGETGYLDARMPDQRTYMAQQGLLWASLQSKEDNVLRELMEIELAKALPMWRQPNDTSALRPLQWEILDLLADPPEGNMSQMVIAERLGRDSGSGQVKGDLSDLRKRGLIDNEPRRGYFRVEV